MGYAEANDPRVLRHYERLVYSTAARLVGQGVEVPVEDIQQIIRIKVWRALTTFDAKRIQRVDESRASARDRYVFMAVLDQSKDLFNRVRRGERFIEDLVTDSSDEDGPSGVRRDKFEQAHGLLTTEEAVYGQVEDEGAPLPSTLNDLERRLVLLLYRDYKQSEAGRLLGLPKYELEKTMRSVREKMADWKPTIDATPGDAGGRQLQPPVLA